ncbi:MAG: cell division protein FtsQ/DivIB [Pseudomonadota bacterium]
MSAQVTYVNDQFDFEDKVSTRRKQFTGSVLVILIIALMVWGGRYLSNPDTLPIKQVRVEGDFTRLSPVDLQQLVTNKVRGGFFNLNVDAVRDALLAEPWVSKVSVQRVWPDGLRVIVTEQIPIVRWGEKGLLNKSGDYFQPESMTIPQHLPLLTGPEGSEILLLKRFQEMQQRVNEIKFSIVQLTLDERRAWSFTLANGIYIILGRKQVSERFQRFLDLIPTTVAGRIEQTATVDMRYTNGFAVKWKK